MNPVLTAVHNRQVYTPLRTKLLVKALCLDQKPTEGIGIRLGTYRQGVEEIVAVRDNIIC